MLLDEGADDARLRKENERSDEARECACGRVLFAAASGLAPTDGGPCWKLEPTGPEALSPASLCIECLFVAGIFDLVSRRWAGGCGWDVDPCLVDVKEEDELIPGALRVYKARRLSMLVVGIVMASVPVSEMFTLSTPLSTP